MWIVLVILEIDKIFFVDFGSIVLEVFKCVLEVFWIFLILELFLLMIEFMWELGMMNLMVMV